MSKKMPEEICILPSDKVRLFGGRYTTVIIPASANYVVLENTDKITLRYKINYGGDGIQLGTSEKLDSKYEEEIRALLESLQPQKIPENT